MFFHHPLKAIHQPIHVEDAVNDVAMAIAAMHRGIGGHVAIGGREGEDENLAIDGVGDRCGQDTMFAYFAQNPRFV